MGCFQPDDRVLRRGIVDDEFGGERLSRNTHDIDPPSYLAAALGQEGRERVQPEFVAVRLEAKARL
jgi:hypothetical protein